MDRFSRAAALFEAAHREDPKPFAAGTWSSHYHARVAHHLEVIDPSASEALRLAALCAHIRRWTIPRDKYEEGRSGYKRWRSDLARFHGEQAEGILRTAGYDDALIHRVQDILQKRRLATDLDVQTFEDALCLVFIENELEEFSTRHDEAKLIGILTKTWTKMSPRGHDAAGALLFGLPTPVRALVERALSGA